MLVESTKQNTGTAYISLFNIYCTEDFKDDNLPLRFEVYYRLGNATSGQEWNSIYEGMDFSEKENFSDR